MGNMVSKRVRKGIVKRNRAIKKAAKKPVKIAAPAKPEVKGKK